MAGYGWLRAARLETPSLFPVPDFPNKGSIVLQWRAARIRQIL